MKTVYVLEPLILLLQDAFMEYSEFFQNDLPLNVINTLHITSNGTILRCNLDNIEHNQEQKLKLYNYLFYKLIVSKKYNEDYSKRIASVKNGLNMIIWFDSLFSGMSVCNYEEYALNKSITPRLKRQKLESLMCPPKDKAINFKLFGYSTKNNFNIRIYALNQAIEFYGIDNVLRVLKKIQHFNLCLKEDYLYLQMRYHFFPKQYVETKKGVVFPAEEDDKLEVAEGLCPNVMKTKHSVVIGSLEHGTYDFIAYKNVYYFKNYDTIIVEQEALKTKMRKMYACLKEHITY